MSPTTAAVMVKLAISAVLLLVASITAVEAQRHTITADAYSLLGCYLDSGQNRIMEHHHLVRDAVGSGDWVDGVIDRTGAVQPISIEGCYAACSGWWLGVSGEAEYFGMFGLQYTRECWCSNTPDVTKNGGERPLSECDQPCANPNGDQNCGGDWRMAVYIRGETPCASSDLANAGTGNYAGYLGCYRDTPDRAMPFLMVSLPMIDWNGDEVESDHFLRTCVSWCGGDGYAYAGLQYGRECWCGNTCNKWGLLPEDECTGPIDDPVCTGQEQFGYLSECNMPCEDDSDIIYTCGGEWAMSVYRT